MSENTGDKKLGRNPFDHKRPSRARRHEPGEAPAVNTIPAQPAGKEPQEPGQLRLQSGNPGGHRLPANPAWFFVDLWAGALTEPYFFWARLVSFSAGQLVSLSADQPTTGVEP